jgi:hypothetical protein
MRNSLETGDDLPVTITVLYGRVEIVNTRRWEGDKLICGGYAIHHDRNGKETHRTADEPLSSLDFSECPENKWMALLT